MSESDSLASLIELSERYTDTYRYAERDLDVEGCGCELGGAYRVQQSVVWVVK